MYFLSKNNTPLYSMVAHMRPAYRYLVSVVAIGVFLYGWFVFAYKPAQGVVLEQQRLVQRLHDDHNKCDESHGACKNLVASINNLERELAAYRLPSSASAAPQSPMMFVLDAAHKSGLHLNGCNLQKEQEKNWYTQQTIDFDFEGALEQQLHFFTALKNAHALIGCEQLRINAMRENLYHLTCSLDLVALK